MSKTNHKLNQYSYVTVGPCVSSSTSALTSSDCDLHHFPTSKSKSVSFLLNESFDQSKHFKNFPPNHSIRCWEDNAECKTISDADQYPSTVLQNYTISGFNTPDSSNNNNNNNSNCANTHYDSYDIPTVSPFSYRRNYVTSEHLIHRSHSSENSNSRKSFSDIRSNPIFVETDHDEQDIHNFRRSFIRQHEISSINGNDHDPHGISALPSCDLMENTSTTHHCRDPCSSIDSNTPYYPFNEENFSQNVYYIKSTPCSSFPCECPCNCSCSSSSNFQVVNCDHHHSVIPLDKIHHNIKHVCEYHDQNPRSFVSDDVSITATNEIFYHTPSLSLDGQQDQTAFMLCVRILWPCVFLHRVKREISDSPPLPPPPPPPSSSQETFSTRIPTCSQKSKSLDEVDEQRKAPIRYSVISYSTSSSIIGDGGCSKIPKRTIFVFILCIAAVFGLTTTNMFNVNDYEERLHYVHSLLNDTILVDGHNDLAWNIRMYKHNLLNKYNYDQNLKRIHPWSTSNWSHTDLPRLRSGRVGAQMWSAYIHCESQFKDAVQMTLEQIDLIKRFTKMYSNMFNLCLSYNDVIETGKQKKVCSIITLEGGHSIANSLAVLRMYYDLGVRSMALTNKDCSTPWAEAAQMEGKTENRTFPVIGLNKFGLTVVHELNRLGMVIDLSGTSANTMKDTLNASKAPVIFSHSNARTVCNVTQNVPDDILQLLVQNNGVVMVTFYPDYLSCKSEADISNVVDHINYLKNKAGVDHIGIGSGFDGIDRVPENLNDTSFFPELFTALTAPGNPKWSVEELKKLAGQNILRVLQDAEKVRDSLQNVSPHEDVFKRYNNKTTGRRYDRDMRVCISHNHILN